MTLIYLQAAACRYSQVTTYLEIRQVIKTILRYEHQCQCQNYFRYTCTCSDVKKFLRFLVMKIALTNCM